jgi:CRP/FNR family transcriptional regulator, cyclic AMP receptor protein
MPPTRIELLQGMPIFGAIRETALQLLLDQAQTVSIRAKDFFFREGDQASGMFVLEKGSVMVTKAWRDKQWVLRHLGPGDCFGEMALMDLLPRSASVQAIEDCTAIEVRPEHLYRLFECDVEQFALIQMNMGREVSRRLRVTDELLFHAEVSAARDPGDLLRST